MESPRRANTSRCNQLNYSRSAGELVLSKKIAIVGNLGAGKTTLAERLHRLLEIDYFELPSDSTLTTDEVQEFRWHLVQKEKWIIDDDRGLLDLADTIIFLGFPLFLCLVRVAARSFHSFLTWHENVARALSLVPSKSWSLLRLLTAVSRYPSRKRPAMTQRLASQSIKGVTIRLTSPRQLRALIRALEALARRRHAE